MPRNWLKTLTTSIPYAVYNIQYTGYNIRDTIYGIQYTIYGIQPHGRPDGQTARRPDGRGRVQILLVQIL